MRENKQAAIFMVSLMTFLLIASREVFVFLSKIGCETNDKNR